MNKKYFIRIVMATVFSFSVKVAAGQGMAVNTTGTAANASAILDVSSVSQGILVPRMTSAQRSGISSPATGLLVYQTDATSGFYYNSGTPGSPVWVSLNALSNVTTQGNTFNGSNQLVQTNGSGQLPAISGTNLTNLNGANLAANSVTVGKLPSGATAATFLRGDGTWATPSGGGAGGTVDLIAKNTTSQSFSTPSTTAISFNSTYVSPTIGSFNGSGYTVGTAGNYLVVVGLGGDGSNAVASMSLLLTVNGTAVQYATAAGCGACPSPHSRSNLTAVLKLNAGDVVVANAVNVSNFSMSATTDGTTNMVITKL